MRFWRSFGAALDVRPGEGQSTALLFALSFVLGLARPLVSAAANAIYLSQLDPNSLPYLYIGIAIIVTVGPQPDLALVRRTADYPSGKPLVADLLLIIEVADTSLGYDRSEKIPLYARAGVHEVWLVDLTHEMIYVYLKPDRVAGAYSVVSRRRRGGQVAPLFAPKHALAVDAILGPGQPKQVVG